MKRKNNSIPVVTAAMIAALYVVLSITSNAFGLASGVIQIRISEALTILPYFTFSAVPGLTIGCLLFNLLSGASVLDVLVGSLATFLGATGTYHLRKLFKTKAWQKFLMPLPSITANALLIPWILKTAYGIEAAYWYLVATVGIGEIISCGILGIVLLLALQPVRGVIFR